MAAIAVLRRQILAIPVDGGFVIAERLQAGIIGAGDAPQVCMLLFTENILLN